MGGLGGTTTALKVNINTYPTHIAGLPVAVNICCHVNRHVVRRFRMNAIVIEGKEYHFKMAHPENTEEILSLYQSAMGTEGCTWDETYPSRETIAKDFANQALFIIEDNAHKIAGAISIDEDTEVNALTCWSKQLEPSAELARLVIRETEQNHGLARVMIQKTMEELKKWHERCAFSGK